MSAENAWDTIKKQTPAGPLIDGATDDFVGNPRSSEPAAEVVAQPPSHFTPGMRYDTYVLPDQRMVMVNSLYYVQIDLTTGEFMVRGHEEINTACAIADAQANEKLADAFVKSLSQPPLADTPAPAAPERATPLRAVGRIAGITPDALALNGKDFVRREEAGNGQGQAQGVDRP